MREDKFAKLTVRVDDAHNIEIEPKFIDPRYSLKSSSVRVTGKTGLTQLFEIIPHSGTLPGFVGRWDDKDQLIDVDPEPRDCIDRDAWQGEKGGYRGHHTTKLSDDPRIYYINLVTPNGSVFRARAQLNIEIGVRIADSLHIGIGCEAVVTSKKASRRGFWSAFFFAVIRFFRKFFDRF